MSSSPQPRSNGRLRTLEIDVTQMAALVESHLAEAVSAFERRDVASAERLVVADARIDDMHAMIEARVLDLLGSGPFDPATLREIVTYMKVAGDLERIGDLAKNVAKRTLVVSREKPVKPYAGVARMGRASLRQMADILNAFSSRNLLAAKAVWGGDDELDELYNSVFAEILAAMMEEPQAVSACTHLVFIAKNFERVGDHATNIAEAIHFLITGSALAASGRPKGDQTASIAVKAPPKGRA